MDAFRQKLCENEDVLARFCKERKIGYLSSTKKNYFRDLDHDGDLFHYITTSMSSVDMKAFAEIVHSENYRTCLDLLNEYLAELNIDDYLDIQKLTLKEKCSTYQIAALAKKYNIEPGMQFVRRGGKEYVIIKSTLQDTKSKQGYDDHWIIPNKTICYYMQYENARVVKGGFSFSYVPNQKIFDSLSTGATEPLDIHLFTRGKKGELYEYQGIYRSVGLSEDGRAFILGNSTLSPYDSDVEEARDRFETRFFRANPKDIVRNKKPLVAHKPPSKEEIAAMADRAQNSQISLFSERDYVNEARMKAKIGDIGEEAVWEYEQNKIRKALAHNPDYAEELIKTMAWVSREPGGEKYGYDIRSYNIVNGEAIPIFIEVKTTTSNQLKEFFITEHELQTARSEAVNRNYYIYRVYNINSDQPMFYYMKGDPANFFKLKPFIWLAKVY